LASRLPGILPSLDLAELDRQIEEIAYLLRLCRECGFRAIAVAIVREARRGDPPGRRGAGRSRRRQGPGGRRAARAPGCARC
jgi:hypothetical protein